MKTNTSNGTDLTPRQLDDAQRRERVLAQLAHLSFAQVDPRVLRLVRRDVEAKLDADPAFGEHAARELISRSRRDWAAAVRAIDKDSGRTAAIAREFFAG